MSESIWFYERDGERAGPVSLDELRTLRSGGTLDDGTLVWREGMPDWLPCSEAVPAVAAPPEGVGAGSSGPPPVPQAGAAPSSPKYAGGAAPPVPGIEAPAREVVLRAGFRPRFRATFGRAWRRYLETFWPFVGCYALTSILVAAASQLILPIFFLTVPLMGGLSWYYLQHLRRRPINLEGIFFGFKRRFGDLAILNLIFAIPFFVLFAIVMVLFIVVVVAFASMAESSGSAPEMTPSIVAFFVVGGLVWILVVLAYCAFGAVLSLATLAVLDGDLPWRAALSRSWGAARPHLWKLTFIYFAAISLASLGMLVFYVGAFVGGAWGQLVLVMVYEDAFGEETEAEARDVSAGGVPGAAA